jgi:serine O-acetyltransferase
MRGKKMMGFIRNIKEDIQTIKERDPAIHSALEAFLYPSFKAMCHYRLAHKLYLRQHYYWARYISQRGARKTGIEIHPGAQIGKGFFIDHGIGVIIGETTVIGNNVTLYQGVTLGGTGKEHGKRHPTIGDNVLISAGAKVLGSFTIGENSKIGAGSVVLSEVPPNSTVVGVPGRVVKRYNQLLPRETMSHGELPDPVKEDINCLKKENTELINRLLDMETELKQIKRKLGEVFDRSGHFVSAGNPVGNPGWAGFPDWVKNPDWVGNPENETDNW